MEKRNDQVLRIQSKCLAQMLGIIVKSGEATVNNILVEEIRGFPRIVLFDDRSFDLSLAYAIWGDRGKPAHTWMDMLGKYTEQGDLFIGWNRTQNRLWRYIVMNVLSRRAETIVKDNPVKARALWLQAAATYTRTSLPTKGARPEAYASVRYGWEVSDLMYCLVRAGLCSMGLNEFAQAFVWLHEFHILERNARYNTSSSKALWDWQTCYPKHYDTYFNIGSFLSTYSNAFRDVNNTGSAAYWLWSSYKIFATEEPLLLSSPEIQKVKLSIHLQAYELSKLFHPEPKLLDRMDIKDPSLQVFGSWRKIVPESGKNLPSRMGCATFVHKGYLYALGGEKTQSGPFYREFWRIKLSKCKKWERLPDYPRPKSYLENLMSFEFGVDSKREIAYYFIGTHIMDVFNLNTHEWGAAVTVYRDDRTRNPAIWPYGPGRLQAASVQCFKGKMYVFAGESMAAPLGSNMLMEYDFKTMTWTKLSGSAGWEKKVEYGLPGLRSNVSTWIDPKGQRLYVMYGDANRLGARIRGEPEGDFESHPYYDIWSWDIVNGGWREERIAGNPPCPRTEMSAAYNPVTDHVVVFGGYCPEARSASMSEKNVSFAFSYYADTFVAKVDRDPADSTVSLHWKQVLTSGFPTYRAAAKLIVDDTTGKMYLFSGYVNTQYIPSSKGDGSSRSFGDLWELRIDIPGGGWDQADIDLKDESRNAAVGPWQRCFVCGNFGNWKKCGGSCDGRVHFCGNDCLKEGWNEHKAAHNCRKL